MIIKYKIFNEKKKEGGGGEGGSQQMSHEIM